MLNPTFSSVTADSDPAEETAVVTLARSTRAVGGAGGAEEVVQAARVAATWAMGAAVRASRRRPTARALSGTVTLREFSARVKVRPPAVSHLLRAEVQEALAELEGRIVELRI